MFASINHFARVLLHTARPRLSRFAFAVAGIALLAASASANPNVTFSVRDFLSRDFTNKSIVITPIGGPFIDGTNVVSGQSYNTNTGSGSFTISNMVSGTYRVNLYGNPATAWVMTVPNDDNSYSAAALVVANPPGFTTIQNGLLSSRTVLHTNGNLVGPTNFFSSNLIAGSGVTITYNASGKPTIAASGGGGASGTSAVFVASNYVALLSGPSSNEHAVRLQDLNAASNQAAASLLTVSNASRRGLIFLATFDSPNGFGSNVVAGATPRIGTFRHATGVGAVAPNGLIPGITNNALTYRPVSNAGTIYIGYGAEGTNPIRRVRMLFRYNEVNGSGAAVAPLVHLVGNGEFVASGDLLTHGGFSPQFGTVSFDGHLGGFGSFTQPTVIVTNGWAQFPNFLLETGFRQRVPNVFEYWIDGTNLLGHVNGWQFSMPYTNGAAFGASTNLIVQFFAPGANATTARTPEIMEIAAWDTPYPGNDNEANFPGMVQGQIANAAFYGSNAITAGARFIGTGSNSIETITTLTASNITVVGGTLDLNADRVIGAYTNAGTNFNGVFLTITNSAVATNAGQIPLTIAGLAGGTNDLARATSGGTNRFRVAESGTVIGTGIFLAESTGGNAALNLTNSSGPRISYFTSTFTFSDANSGLILGDGLMRFGATGPFIYQRSTTNMSITARDTAFAGIGTFTNGIAIARTNTYTAAEIPVGGGGIWVSNTAAGRPDAIFISVNGNGSVTNWLVPVTK